MSVPVSRAIQPSVQKFWFLFLLLLVSPAVRAGDGLYYSLQPSAALPSPLTSLLINSGSFNVPAGAVLSVTLLKGETIVATSRLSFSAAYKNMFPAGPLPAAAFYTDPAQSTPGVVLPGATLTPGTADLNALATTPGNYKLLWTMSEGFVVPSQFVTIIANTTDPTKLFTQVPLKQMAVSAALRPNDLNPGSVLIYPRYSSSASNPAREDSSISLSNTNPTESAFVRVFMINNTCQPQEYLFCLAPRRTISVLASDLDPGSRGYIIAVATNAAGQPIQFNWLTGNVLVKQPSASTGQVFDVTLAAYALAKRGEGAVTVTGGTAEMAFNGQMYDQLPAQIVADDVQSQSANNTSLTVFRPLPNLAGGSPSATFRVTGYNSDGGSSGADVNAPGACYRDINLSTLRLTPTIIRDFIPLGTSAWFSVNTTDGQPLIGAQFNFGKFSGGNTSRPLALVSDYRITIPVTALTCPQ